MSGDPVLGAVGFYLPRIVTKVLEHASNSRRGSIALYGQQLSMCLQQPGVLCPLLTLVKGFHSAQSRVVRPVHDIVTYGFCCIRNRAGGRMDIIC